MPCAAALSMTSLVRVDLRQPRPVDFIQRALHDPAEAVLLDRLDFYGNNGWSKTPQLESLMPGLRTECEQAGLPLERVKEAMASVGYSKDALHQIDRWESKRTTGKLGP